VANPGGPFAGLRVVEFGRFIAAPYAAQLLADGGADVIKVEPLTGDETRRNGQIIPGEGRQYLNKNRGKRSLAVDLGRPEALEAVRRLVDRADVVIANFRPRLAEQMGLDYASVAARNPRVVYAENTGYGRRGPRADAPGMDIAMQAYSGIAHLGAHGPEPLANPVIDYAAGLLLAWGISTALYHRERSGRGQKLDVALLQAALVLQNNSVNHVDAVDSWRHDFIEYLKTAFAEGHTWDEVLARRDEMMPVRLARAYYGFLPTQDGTIAIAGGGRVVQRRILEVLQLEDPWVTDPAFETDDAAGHLDRIYERVCARLAEHPTAYWIAAFGANGVPVAAYQTPQEVLDDEQAWANEFLVRLEHELLGGVTVVAPPVRFSETPLAAETASPTLGKHTRAVLREAGLDAAAIDRLAGEGAIVEAP
jgi:CoA:oxalate CoA-transferase